MSRQEEDFKSRAKYFVDKAARESGPYRDVLLGVAEGFAVLALHQAALDEWPRRYPGPLRQQPREAPGQELRQEAREEPRQVSPKMPRELPPGTAAPATIKR
jgi:hypothetical protein